VGQATAGLAADRVPFDRLSGWDATWTSIGAASAAAMATSLGRNDSLIAITRDMASDANLVRWPTNTVTSVYR
jgi:hypothetical protein